MIYYNKQLQRPYRFQYTIDINEKKFVEITYIPSKWTTDTVYKTHDVILPNNFKGIAYKVISSGKTFSYEPSWNHVIGEIITNGAVFEGIDYVDMIDNINLTIASSTFRATESVTLTSPINTTNKTQCFIDTIPADVNSFIITNHIILSNNEEFDFSVFFRVSEK